MQCVLDALLQPQDWKPLELRRRQVDVCPRWWRHDWNAAILAGLILRDELAETLPVRDRRRMATDTGWVLPAFPVPERHHGEEHHAPGKGDHDPELLRLVRRLPPDSRRGVESRVCVEVHGYASGKAAGRESHDLPEPPACVENEHDDQPGSQ